MAENAKVEERHRDAAYEWVKLYPHTPLCHLIANIEAAARADERQRVVEACCAALESLLRSYPRKEFYPGMNSLEHSLVASANNKNSAINEALDAIRRALREEG